MRHNGPVYAKFCAAQFALVTDDATAHRRGDRVYDGESNAPPVARSLPSSLTKVSNALTRIRFNSHHLRPSALPDRRRVTDRPERWYDQRNALFSRLSSTATLTAYQARHNRRLHMHAFTARSVTPAISQ